MVRRITGCCVGVVPDGWSQQRPGPHGWAEVRRFGSARVWRGFHLDGRTDILTEGPGPCRNWVTVAGGFHGLSSIK
jgi:hypothetical protein